jgi:hypothetical protein
MNKETSSARLIRGFSRFGVGAALLIALCGAGYTAFVIAFAPMPAPRDFDAAKFAGIGLGITGVSAFAAFGFFHGLGWILAGFARD